MPRWMVGSCLLLLASSGCGGAVAKNGQPAPTEAGGTSAGVAAGGGTSVSAGAPSGGKTVEVIDDADHTGSQYPTLPPGSSGFFWAGGLGNWFVSSADGVTADAPIDSDISADGTSNEAYHISGMGPGDTVDLWAQLNHVGGLPVDLSAYSGISFKARGSGFSSTPMVYFNANGHPGPGHGLPAQPFGPLAQWQTFSLSFDEVGVDASAISSIDFVLVTEQEPFDLWVDDLALLCKKTCP